MAKSKASRRHGPRIWLMTDPRMGDALLASARALPFGSAIVMRHDRLDPDDRRRLFRQLRRIAKRRGHRLFLAGNARTARQWGADGVHLRGGTGRLEPRKRDRLQRSAPVHDLRQLALASRKGTDWMLVSPVYPTRSHMDAAPLGIGRFARLAARAALRGHVIALGGMSQSRFAMMRALPVAGWAAIDELTLSRGAMAAKR